MANAPANNKVDVAKLVQSARKAITESNARFKRLNEQRSASSTLLHPEDVSGEYDPSRLLQTTLGARGYRPITGDDLHTFQSNIRTLKERYKKGGIKAKEVIDRSTSDRRERTRQQITTGLPVSYKGDEVHFITNAGPDSEVARHHVKVRYLNLEAAIASPAPAEKIVKQVTDGPLAIGCDCHDWRFMGYAYLSTLLGYNAGHRETGYPKARNPELKGVACKHILRAMVLTAQSPTMKAYIANMIKAARADIERKRKHLKKTSQQDIAAQIAKESWRQRAIRTTEEKRPKQTEKLKASAEAKAKKQAITKSVKAVERNVMNLVAQGAITQAQADAMLGALRKK